MQRKYKPQDTDRKKNLTAVRTGQKFSPIRITFLKASFWSQISQIDISELCLLVRRASNKELHIPCISNVEGSCMCEVEVFL
jgi:hypothetical protein